MKLNASSPGCRTSDEFLASGKPLYCVRRRNFFRDHRRRANHVGKIAMLRRLAGDPMRGENYFVAEITVGTVGADNPNRALHFFE